MDEKTSPRERSPNYPSYSLEQTVEFAQKLYGSAGRSGLTFDAAAVALGYKSLSGPSRSKIAAMRHFGLLEDAGQGRVKVSDLAIDIVRPPSYPQFRESVRRAALQPRLFADLHERFPTASDSELHHHLVRERKFSDDGANQVVRSFRDTFAFAKLQDPSYNGGNGQPHSEEEDQSRTPEPMLGAAESTPRKAGLVGGTTVSFNWFLPGGINAHLAFQGPRLTPKAVDRLIDYLQLMKDDLAEEAQPGTEESRAPTAQS